jgi:hypothetical protein
MRSITARLRSSRGAALLGAGVLGTLVSAAAGQDIPFDIVSGELIPLEPFAVKFTVVGSAIQSGPTGYMMPVTMRVHIQPPGGAPDIDIDPFGPFDQAITSNLNPDVIGSTLTGQPMSFILTSVSDPDTEISIRGRSWKLRPGATVGSQDNNDWIQSVYRKSDTSPHVKVLRHGDPVPAMPGFMNQASVAWYLRDYVDDATDTIVLNGGDAIFLFELGSDDPSEEEYDCQDLAVLVEFAPEDGAVQLEPQFD